MELRALSRKLGSIRKSTSPSVISPCRPPKVPHTITATHPPSTLLPAAALRKCRGHADATPVPAPQASSTSQRQTWSGASIYRCREQAVWPMRRVLGNDSGGRRRVRLPREQRPRRRRCARHHAWGPKHWSHAVGIVVGTFRLLLLSHVDGRVDRGRLSDCVFLSFVCSWTESFKVGSGHLPLSFLRNTCLAVLTHSRHDS